MTNKAKAILAGVGGVLVLGGAGAIINNATPRENGGSYTVNQFCEKYVTEENFEKDNKNKIFEITGQIAHNRDVLQALGRITIESDVSKNDSKDKIEIRFDFSGTEQLEGLGENYEVVISGEFKKFSLGALQFDDCKIISKSYTTETTSITTAPDEITTESSTAESVAPETETITQAPTDVPTAQPPVPVITQSQETTYVLNTSTMKIHRPGCRDIDKIDPENRSTTTDYDGAIKSGYTPCGHCF